MLTRKLGFFFFLLPVGILIFRISAKLVLEEGKPIRSVAKDFDLRHVTLFSKHY
jgi:hypothetical protein